VFHEHDTPMRIGASAETPAIFGELDLEVGSR
jgi:hypothetical protein